MKPQYVIIGILLTCYCAISNAAVPVPQPEPFSCKMIEEKKLVNGTEVIVRLHLREFPEIMQAPYRKAVPHEISSKLSGAFCYTDQMEIIYGKKRVDMFNDAPYLPLLDPSSISRIQMIDKKFLVFVVTGGDAALIYGYKFYVDIKKNQLVRSETWMPNATVPAQITTIFRFTSMPDCLRNKAGEKINSPCWDEPEVKPKDPQKLK
jgi:hypothetical protein